MNAGERIGIIGAGAWGTALAVVAASAGSTVVLWTRSAGRADALTAARQNARDLPGVPLPNSIVITADRTTLAGVASVLLAVPAQTVRGVLSPFAAILPEGIPALLCAKGIERGTSAFMSEVVLQVCPSLVPMVLSGPSFAGDVARGLPTAVTLAGPDLAAAASAARPIGPASFRIYTSDDIRGVEIGGAVKNVLAIGCGIVEGMGLGASARAALTTRAFAELARFGQTLGARTETLSGLSGLGDLILTCSSPQSRNFALGLALGRGLTLDEALAGRQGVCEGVHTAPVLLRLAGLRGIEMPICESVEAILAGRSRPKDELARLLARPPRAEFD